MLVGKYWVGCGGQKNPSLACKQLHVGAEECQELFLFLGWVGHLLWQSEDLLTPLQMSFTFFSSLILEGKREGRSVGRKGGKKWKHLSRRAEAIRNACWVSKTENREKGIKIKSSVKKKEDEVGKGFAILWKEGPGQSIILCQVPFRLDKVNITTWWKRDKGGERMVERVLQAAQYEAVYMKLWRWREGFMYALFLQLSRQPYLIAGHRFKKIITALSNVKSHLWAQKTHKEKQRERDREAHSFSSPLIMSTVILSFPSFYAGLPK